MQAVETAPAMAPGAKLWPLSVAAYHALGEAGLIPENTELLYGFVYTKMPKSPLHTFMLEQMQEMLSRSVPPGKLLRSEQPLTLLDSEPEPDLAVVHGARSDFKSKHPSCAELVVEIAVSSQDYDRLKLRAYAAAGVNECWLTLVPERQIHVFRNPVDGQYAEQTVYGPGGRLLTPALPGLSLDLEAIFAK